MKRKYYEAYDDRYRQVHSRDLQWFCNEPTPIVGQVIDAFGISKKQKLLEIGCGEGRDAFALLRQGYDLLATDVSQEAVSFCAKRLPGYADRFQRLDCVTGALDMQFDFIYAVAVIHMLVPDPDRDAFYQFIRKHLKPGGIGLICTMGDGTEERQTDIGSAFQLQDRVHEPSGTAVQIASTSCRMVNFQTFSEELKHNGLTAVKQGITSVEPDFPQMMYAVVKK